ncbi:MAG: transposase [Ignavibacteriae bacterium]|nr:MAG: transposase [Ignavibacteriota bacterium]
MTLFKNTFRIESTRLKGYDYSHPGDYFATICVRNHECILGDVEQEIMNLSNVGNIAKKCWEQIPDHFHYVTLDEFIVMPNHIHGIIIINDQRGRDVQLNVSTKDSSAIISPKKGTLSVIIRTYKAAVTRECRRIGSNEFRWQPGFYEHIIRDEKGLQHIRDYIINNPIKWFYDRENPIFN